MKYFVNIICAKLIKGDVMRSTVTIKKEILDRLLKETKTKSKASAVREAINEYLRRKKIEKIKFMKGKMEFDLTAEEIRHYER